MLWEATAGRLGAFAVSVLLTASHLQIAVLGEKDSEKSCPTEVNNLNWSACKDGVQYKDTSCCEISRTRTDGSSTWSDWSFTIFGLVDDTYRIEARKCGPPCPTEEDNSGAISATIAGVGGALVGTLAGFCVGRQFNKGRKEARNVDDDINLASMAPSHSQFYPDDSRTFQTLASGSRTDRLSTRQSGTDQLTSMPQLASNSSRMHHLSTAGSRIDQVSRSSLNKGQSGSRLFNN